MDSTVPLAVIGVVRTARVTPENTPIQSSLNRAEHGVIEIAAAYRDGLDGLEGFSHAWLLSWLHRRDGRVGRSVPLRQVPFLLRTRQQEVGIFATRGPRRVNPIGLSLIEVLDVTPAAVHFAGVDLIDGTPVIDLKPYVSRFDRPDERPRCGWFDGVAIEDEVTPADLGQPNEPT